MTSNSSGLAKLSTLVAWHILRDISDLATLKDHRLLAHDVEKVACKGIRKHLGPAGPKHSKN